MSKIEGPLFSAKSDQEFFIGEEFLPFSLESQACLNKAHELAIKQFEQMMQKITARPIDPKISRVHSIHVFTALLDLPRDGQTKLTRLLNLYLFGVPNIDNLRQDQKQKRQIGQAQDELLRLSFTQSDISPTNSGINVFNNIRFSDGMRGALFGANNFRTNDPIYGSQFNKEITPLHLFAGMLMEPTAQASDVYLSRISPYLSNMVQGDVRENTRLLIKYVG